MDKWHMRECKETSPLQTRASDSCLMLDYVRVINFRIIIIIKRWFAVFWSSAARVAI